MAFRSSGMQERPRVYKKCIRRIVPNSTLYSQHDTNGLMCSQLDSEKSVCAYDENTENSPSIVKTHTITKAMFEIVTRRKMSEEISVMECDDFTTSKILGMETATSTTSTRLEYSCYLPMETESLLIESFEHISLEKEVNKLEKITPATVTSHSEKTPKMKAKKPMVPKTTKCSCQTASGIKIPCPEGLISKLTNNSGPTYTEEEQFNIRKSLFENYIQPYTDEFPLPDRKGKNKEVKNSKCETEYKRIEHTRIVSPKKISAESSSSTSNICNTVEGWKKVAESYKIYNTRQESNLETPLKGNIQRKKELAQKMNKSKMEIGNTVIYNPTKNFDIHDDISIAIIVEEQFENPNETDDDKGKKLGSNDTELLMRLVMEKIKTENDDDRSCTCQVCKPDETTKSCHVLRETETNFSMMQTVCPETSRRELKRKIKKEVKRNIGLMDEVSKPCDRTVLIAVPRRNRGTDQRNRL